VPFETVKPLNEVNVPDIKSLSFRTLYAVITGPLNPLPILKFGSI
jgi:hypothetical protein